MTAERPHVKFRREAMAIAMTMLEDGPPVSLDPVDHNTPAGLAHAIATVFSAYDWTVTTGGELAGLVAGDHGYTLTGIFPDKDRR
jgi:hypothetical protein